MPHERTSADRGQRPSRPRLRSRPAHLAARIAGSGSVRSARSSAASTAHCRPPGDSMRRHPRPAARIEARLDTNEEFFLHVAPGQDSSEHLIPDGRLDIKVHSSRPRTIRGVCHQDSPFHSDLMTCSEPCQQRGKIKTPRGIRGRSQGPLVPAIFGVCAIADLARGFFIPLVPALFGVCAIRWRVTDCFPCEFRTVDIEKPSFWRRILPQSRPFFARTTVHPSALSEVVRLNTGLPYRSRSPWRMSRS